MLTNAKKVILNLHIIPLTLVSQSSCAKLSMALPKNSSGLWNGPKLWPSKGDLRVVCVLTGKKCRFAIETTLEAVETAEKPAWFLAEVV